MDGKAGKGENGLIRGLFAPEKASQDIIIATELQGVEKREQTTDTNLTLAQKTISFERQFIELARKAVGDQYKLINDFRIENVVFDLLLKSPILFEKDYIFEIKYSESRIGGNYFHYSIEQLQRLLTFYRQNIKNNTNGRLLFILPKNALEMNSHNSEALYGNTKSLIDMKNKELKDDGIKVCYLEVENISRYTIENFYEFLRE